VADRSEGFARSDSAPRVSIDVRFFGIAFQRMP
jgi:hypothetical protein